jgi:hypothetical protein
MFCSGGGHLRFLHIDFYVKLQYMFCSGGCHLRSFHIAFYVKLQCMFYNGGGHLRFPFHTNNIHFVNNLVILISDWHKNIHFVEDHTRNVLAKLAFKLYNDFICPTSLLSVHPFHLLHLLPHPHPLVLLLLL